jgi:type VI secretion system secreted protein VgrG
VTATMYSSLTETITGPWAATVSNAITIESTGGTILIKSPSMITLDAPSVKNKASGQWFKWTPFAVELFGSKNSAGVHKFDNTAINMSTNGVKLEATFMALAKSGVKMEQTGLGVSNVAIKLDTGVMKNKNRAVELSNETLAAYTGAFTSLAKAFMKIG